MNELVTADLEAALALDERLLGWTSDVTEAPADGTPAARIGDGSRATVRHPQGAPLSLFAGETDL